MIKDQNEYVICFTFETIAFDHVDRVYFNYFPTKSRLLEALSKEWSGQIPSHWATDIYNEMKDFVNNLDYPMITQQFECMSIDSCVEEMSSKCIMHIEYMPIY